MCLIIFSKTGKLPAEADFREAAKDNPDGIGVMSADGAQKFLGRKHVRRAWRYVRQLSAEGLPFGIHFRWATHGEVTRANAHPFEVPTNGALVMHNGILWTSAYATTRESDTAIFCTDVLPKILDFSHPDWKLAVTIPLDTATSY